MALFSIPKKSGTAKLEGGLRRTLLTTAELAAASRKARPTKPQRAEFARLRAELKALRKT